MTRVIAICALLSSLVVSALARAHAVGISSGFYAPSEHGLHASLVFAHADLIATRPSLDADMDGVVDASELDSSGAGVRAFADDALSVTANSSRCRLLRAEARIRDAGSVSLDAHFECAKGQSPTAVELRFLKQLGREHRHRGSQLGSSEALYFGEKAAISLAPSPAKASSERGYFEYVRMGFWHILRGLDHVAFVVTLLLSLRRIKTLLAVISAFTLAHSFSLALVTCSVWTPSPRWVEPAIALSIVYLALESARRRAPKHPALISFAFGLVHGMGFASALRELALPAREIPAALLLFNGGVELGQLLLLCALVPLLHFARRNDWCVRRALPACSIALAACGVFWFATRIA